MTGIGKSDTKIGDVQMFEVGDAVVHPVRGAGIVTDIEEFQLHGSSKEYYKIDLLSPVRTNMMVPVKRAEEQGMRRAIQPSRLDLVWCVLRARPDKLPTDHQTRQKFIKGELQSGDFFQVAEAVRDLAWKQQQSKLTTGDRRMYRRGMELLAGEMAASRGANPENTEDKVELRLLEIMSKRHRRQYLATPGDYGKEVSV
jgi:CarD family transcriptional regulator